jgi:FkbM family methyltransferase
MAAPRQTFSLGLLRGLAWASRVMYGRPDQPGLHRLRVLAGPLRGTYLSTPALTRLSFCLGTYQAGVVDLMKRFVAPGMTAYDLGAHMGYFTLLLSKLVGHDGRVFAFEPDPHNLRALRSNLEGNRHPVTVTPAAVADASGEVTFASFGFSSVSHIADSRTPSDAVRITVPAITLDDFVYRDGNPTPNFIKIDVEGAEARVIRGAERVLREASPVVVVEARRSHWVEVEGSMRDLGYRGHVLGGEEGMARAGVADVLFVPATM